MNNSRKKSNKIKYENDEDDISIRSLFSPDPLEEINYEPPTFSNYGNRDQNIFPTSNNSNQPVQRNSLGFGFNLTPLISVPNKQIRNFDYLSSKKTIFQPTKSIFSLPCVNPNRKIIRLNNVKPIQIATPQSKTLVVKPNQNRPDPLFTKIIYNKPQNNVLISLPKASHINSNRSSVSISQPYDNRFSTILYNSPNPQDSHKTKVIHHYHFYENPFKFLKKNNIIQNQIKNIPVINSTTQIEYLQKNGKFMEKNITQRLLVIKKNSLADSPSFDSDENFMYHS
jgi:hypothetical protein